MHVIRLGVHHIGANSVGASGPSTHGENYVGAEHPLKSGSVLQLFAQNTCSFLCACHSIH